MALTITRYAPDEGAVVVEGGTLNAPHLPSPLLTRGQGVPLPSDAWPPTMALTSHLVLSLSPVPQKRNPVHERRTGEENQAQHPERELESPEVGAALLSASGGPVDRLPAASVDGEAGPSNHPRLALLRGENTLHISFQLACERHFNLESENTRFGRLSSVGKNRLLRRTLSLILKAYV